MTGAVDDKNPLTDITRHRYLCVLKQMGHVNHRVSHGRRRATGLCQARVDDRTSLLVETDLSLNKYIDQLSLLNMQQLLLSSSRLFTAVINV